MAHSILGLTPNQDPLVARGEHGDSGVEAGRLEERLKRASDQAERLIAEAAQAAARGRGGGPAPGDGADPDTNTEPPPPAGWELPGVHEAAARSTSEAERLAELMRLLRELIPPDLQRRLAEALHELLLALRAVLDLYIERLDRRRHDPVEVEDIPIL